MRWCWVNFQCRGVLLVWIKVGQGPFALAEGAGGGCLDIFSLVYHFSFLSPSLWETARYRLKYCLKGPLSPKQPTNQIELLLETQILSFQKEFATLETNYFFSDLTSLILLIRSIKAEADLLYFRQYDLVCLLGVHSFL